MFFLWLFAIIMIQKRFLVSPWSFPINKKVQGIKNKYNAGSFELALLVNEITTYIILAVTIVTT